MALSPPRQLFVLLLLSATALLAFAQITKPPEILVPASTYQSIVVDGTKDTFDPALSFSVSNKTVKICSVSNIAKIILTTPRRSKGQMTRVVLYQIGRETADNLILVQLREKKHRQYTFTPQVIYELMKNTDDGKVRSMWESAKNVYFYVRHNNKPVTVTVAKQDCGFFVDATDNILKKRSPPNPPEMIRRKDELVAVVVP